MSITYKDSGVDIEKGDALVEKIKAKVKSTYGSRVKEGVGGFACLYEMGDKLLAAGTDGVGTKLMIAQKLNKHNTIGIDLVAMCANDILCTGAKGLFFMDYLATGKLDLEVSEALIDGVVEGCSQAQMALIGGETAEMPGMYGDGDYDLAGFAVGEVDKDKVLNGSHIKAGDTIMGIASSGFHSNGYSLVRKLVREDETELLEACLTPTRIYCDLVYKIQDEVGPHLHGLAHITGGGFTNVARLNKNFDYKITDLPEAKDLPREMLELTGRSGLPKKELYTTFNMGVGLMIITDAPEKVAAILDQNNETYWTLGKVVEGEGKVFIEDQIL